MLKDSESKLIKGRDDFMFNGPGTKMMSACWLNEDWITLVNRSRL